MGEVCPGVAKTPQIGQNRPLHGACKAHFEYDEYDMDQNFRYVQKKASKY